MNDDDVNVRSEFPHFHSIIIISDFCKTVFVVVVVERLVNLHMGESYTSKTIVPNYTHRLASVYVFGTNAKFKS